MEKLTLKWNLIEDAVNERVERYCHNCGKKVIFKDSLKRRKNANGKNIFEYAIYKCDRGHTWNHCLVVYKSTTEIDRMQTVVAKESRKMDIIELAKAKELGIREIEIVLTQVTGKWRIDKLLGQQVQDLSRSQIEKSIKSGVILLDGEITKPGTKLKENQRINLLIDVLV